MLFRKLLKTAPPDAVRSLDELFAIAQAMEHEAAARYAQLAERVRAEGSPELAALFEQLASEEWGHEGSVQDWSRQRLGKAPDPAAIRWQLPETFDAETAEELASSRLINAYRVLSMAVRNEERAFALWSYIAAQAETAEIREAAERMAHEELEHVSLLRRARRNAYHAERDSRAPEPALTVGALIAQAAALERMLAAQLDRLADGLAGEDASRSRELAAQTRAMAETVAALTPEAARTPALAELSAPATAESLVETYLDIGDRSRDETVVASAQMLAREAIARLAWLRLLA